PQLARRPPAEVGGARAGEVRVGDGLEAAREVKARRQLAGDRLDLDEAALAREPHRALVEPLGLELAAFEPRDLGVDEREPVGEIVGRAPGGLGEPAAGPCGRGAAGRALGPPRGVAGGGPGAGPAAGGPPPPRPAPPPPPPA